MQKIQSIHFVGIKGVGMTPLAVIAKEAGMSVTGSDSAERFITDEILEKAGIIPFHGFDKNHVGTVDLVITSGANGGFDNEEVKAAKDKGISVMTQGQAVGYFMSGEPFGKSETIGISVAGCHGKTTTSAMIATVLKGAGKDPSFVVGTGRIPSLGSSGHFGNGDFFVAEADEYATEPQYDKTPKFLWQHPQIAVVTNIEYDHLDLYPTFASLVEAYKTFMSQVLESGGKLVVCGDDPEIRKIIDGSEKHAITYGFNSGNNYVLSNIEDVVGGTGCSVAKNGTSVGSFLIPILGEHNALNALATLIVGQESGLTVEEIQQGLSSFQGTKRRLEYVGKLPSGAYVFDDYAHHPTEIQKTLTALRRRYKEMNIICVFQPHTFSRTKLLFEEFTSSFSDVNTLILTDIYASKREAFDSSISSQDLAQAVKNPADVLYLPSLSDVVQYVHKKQFDAHTILVTMGAGDVYQVAYELIQS